MFIQRVGAILTVTMALSGILLFCRNPNMKIWGKTQKSTVTTPGSRSEMSSLDFIRLEMFFGSSLHLNTEPHLQSFQNASQHPQRELGPLLKDKYASAVTFAAHMRTEIEKALQEESVAHQLFQELKECALSRQEYLSAEVQGICLVHLKLLGETYPQLEAQALTLMRKANPEALRLIGG
jgi:hypothetical protein